MYAELHCHSAFSFLDGASLPDELVSEAHRLDYHALALTDRNGVYASLAYVVTQRRREIAVRVAVGADATQIRRLVLREGVAIVIGGVLSGTLLSLALTRVLSTQLYGVSATDPGTFAAMASLLGLAALLAAASPIRDALRIQPAEALRAE